MIFPVCGESWGNYQNTTLTKLKNDLKTIIGFVKKQPEVDKNKIGILAQSFGTSVVVALGPKIKSLVMLGAIAYPEKSY